MLYVAIYMYCLLPIAVYALPVFSSWAEQLFFNERCGEYPYSQLACILLSFTHSIFEFPSISYQIHIHPSLLFVGVTTEFICQW